MVSALEAVSEAHEAGQWVCVVHTLVLPDMRRMVSDACEEMGIRELDLMGSDARGDGGGLWPRCRRGTAPSGGC